MRLSRQRTPGIICVLMFLSILGCDQLVPKPKQPFQPKVASVEDADLVADISLSSKEKDSALDDDMPLPQGVLARVGNWTLTMDEFNERLLGVKQAFEQFNEAEPGAKGMVLDELIRQQLLVQEARSIGIDKMKDIRGAVEDFENTLLVQEVAGRLTKYVVITESEAKEFYDANNELFIVPVERDLREIVVLTEAEAKDIYVQILQGSDFAQIARERSQGRSKEMAGDLGYLKEFPFEGMQSEIENLKKGEISRVFNGPEGFYIVKVDDIRGGDKQPFVDIKEELIKGLTLQAQQKAILEKMAEVAQKVKVKVNADLLKE